MRSSINQDERGSDWDSYGTASTLGTPVQYTDHCCVEGDHSEQSTDRILAQESLYSLEVLTAILSPIVKMCTVIVSSETLL